MIELLTDPILRGPTLGSMLIGQVSGLIGALVFLQKKSLVGETLAHATYPGIVLGALVASFFSFDSPFFFFIAIFMGASISAILGLWMTRFLEKRHKIHSDASLCFVLSLFFGIGVLLVSRLQFTHFQWVRQIQLFLFGQAATLRDLHVGIYALFSIGVILLFFLLFRPLQILHFDQGFAKTIGVKVISLERITSFLLVIAIVLGMRSVGVVLISALLIAPPVAARQWTSHFSSFLIVSSLLGLLSAFLGNVVSNYLVLKEGVPALPTGPTIVIAAAFFCLVSLLFSPQRGVISRWIRVISFRLVCQQENILKSLYMERKDEKKKKILQLFMYWRGWIKEGKLTEKGRAKASELVRLHRLWEVYLVHMRQGVDKVHKHAEEMEHFLTPELEMQLQELLNRPTRDPHHQPIPEEDRHSNKEKK